MAAMASFFDVVHLDDTLSVSCKDVKKQGSLRYYMLSAFLTMMEVFHALYSLWVTLLPFALLCWNVMMYAVCAKYWSWNRARLWLQAAERCYCGEIMQELCALFEPSIAEEGETRSSPSQRESSADAPHVDENREMSIVSLCRLGACTEPVHADKRYVDTTSHKLPYGLGVAVHPSILHALDGDGVVAAADLEDLCPRHLIHSQEQIPREATSHALKAQAISASCLTSKFSPLCFLEERGPQVCRFAEDCHWATCSFLLAHQVQPLAMFDVCQCPLIPSKHACLQVNLDRDCKMLLHLKAPSCIDHVFISWSLLREWLRIFNGCCIPRVHHGKKCPNVEWGFTETSTSQIRNDNHAIVEFILSTIDGFTMFDIISSYGTTENVNLLVGEQQTLMDLSSFQMKNNIALVDNGSSALDSSEDIGSARCSSLKSDDRCDGPYCTSPESITDRDDGLEYSDGIYRTQSYRDDGREYSDRIYGTQSYRDDGLEYSDVIYSTQSYRDDCLEYSDVVHYMQSYRDDGLEYSDVFYGTQCRRNDACCCYMCCHGIEDSGINSVEDTEGVHGNFLHPAMDKGDNFYDCSARCNVGCDEPHHGMYVDDICSTDYDADESDYINLDSNVEVIGAVLGDFHVVDKDGVYANSREVHATISNTWWDEDAVLIVDKKETEEESSDEEWQVV